MNYNIDNFHTSFTDKMTSEKPYFLGRIGGTDFDVIKDYLYDLEVNKTNLFDKNPLKEEFYINEVSNFNGYFDKSKNRKERKKNFHRYINKLIKCYENMSDYTYCGSYLINQFKDINKMDPNVKHFVQKYLPNKNSCDYTFIEAVRPFLSCFSQFAVNKKVLIVSPFSDVIKKQFERKDKILHNYEYPDFTLLTYTTPVTYNNATDDLSYIKTENWLEQCKLMCSEIEKLDFDIALLACASYGMILGNHIYKKMNKKAIYIGGVLNVFFNIYGGRFNTTFFNSIMNLKYQVKFKPPNYDKINGARIAPTEGLNAYF